MANERYYWYKANKGTVHEVLFPYLANLETKQSERQAANVQNMRLYGDRDFRGFAAHQLIPSGPLNARKNQVTLNVVQSMIDTIVSKITKNRPRPQFLTDGGNFTQQRRAEKLTQFSEGVYYQTDYYNKAAMAFKDSCIFGTGCLKFYRDGDKIKVERVFIDEIKVDDVEAYYGEPRSMHQTKWVHKDVLKATFPGYDIQIDAAIADSSSTNKSPSGYSTRDGDMVLVIESWHLSSGPKKKDGRRVIAITTATFVDERYDKDYFPFEFFRWNKRPLGFFGQGVAEQLTGLQVEINKLLKTVQIAMHLVSVPKLFVEASSKIVDTQLNNQIGSVIKFVGQPPTPGQLGVIPPELFAQIDRLYQKAFEIVGVSQLSAQAQKPAGLDSGKAMRTYNDIETERFMDVGKRFQDTFVSGTKHLIDMAKEIAQESGFEVKAPGQGFLKSIKWEDIDLDEDSYIMQAFPVSKLSNDPEGRLQQIQEYVQAGFIGKEDAMDLLELPDLKAFTSIQNAAVEDIKRQIEMMVDTGEYQAPEPYQNLDYGTKRMQSAYLMYRSQGAPEETLELFRRWIEDATTLIKNAQVEMQAQQQAAMAPTAPMGDPAITGAPTGVPGAPPVSELLPTAPVQ